MMLFSSLSRMLGGNLESREVEELRYRESGLGLFKNCSFLGIENSSCSISVSKFPKFDPLFII
jgi:hypothetical protein